MRVGGGKATHEKRFGRSFIRFGVLWHGAQSIIIHSDIYESSVPP